MPFAPALGLDVCVWGPPPRSTVVSAGMNMPLHQISVIPRDVTSSRVCGNGKAKDKDKQVREELLSQDFSVIFNCGLKIIQYVRHVPSI